MDPNDPLARLLAGALDFLTWLVMLPKQGYVNLMRNSVEMWDGMTPFKYIRMIAILGGYLFLRPYLSRFGERAQAKQHEKAVALAREKEKEALGANAIRDGDVRAAKGKSVKFSKGKEDADSKGESVGEGEGEEWGKKARKRQKAVEKMVEERMKSEQEENGDIDIMEHLVDYEEGVDGW
ncbi:uncharacterized protein L3040_008463 [Drepanopeziza brunnea f. sp. 'multigermtubi']|uniref:Trafficking PGA2 n=1 Tax=Marssonina brunnea f. sp. multigermtubi (strain MB_m1) TaxID=1072389 RepID=K1X6T1_MARBU|nr:trafficking PGA2 [Drepanopeziza brunnea f. sp. 'multigermtubi' MB_m1]EKD16363.1 trafficking PGA2 [Drepanopeziza brunnea f. sp. 'multigermtubi' MB_m1]KAJ5033345.1 hypothetical protein L3040_008463 [Drepanopeziza brunnea f. sp. 'multigermtubi']